MIRKKDGFLGEREIVLPPMVVEQEENDALVSSLYLTDIGFYPHAVYHYRKRDNGAAQNVLLYCVDGCGQYRVGNKEYYLQKNQYVILPAGVAHCYEADANDPWTIYWVHFTGSLAYEYAEGATKPQAITINMSSRICDRNNIFEEILNTLEDGYDLEHLRYTSALLHHYLASLRLLKPYRSASKPKENDKDEIAVKAAIHFMKENMERHITLKEITHFVGYSTAYFSTVFKKVKGSSPLTYFNNMKIRQACHLLESTDMKINQVSSKIGIDDSLYFSRLFSKAVGMSPREYAQQKRCV